MKSFKAVLAAGAFALLATSTSVALADNCIDCHTKVSPGMVKDFQASKHAESGEVTCDTCHGDAHSTAEDYKKAKMPTEAVCMECHEEQYESFAMGKHNFGWTTLNAIPGTHLAPDELMEGGRGCGGCHNMGIRTEEQLKAQADAGYRYQTNSCDECHTRHTFSKKEANNPRACQTCHMGYDHPQWEMWSSSKHGVRYFAKLEGSLPEGAAAPTCQTCHLPDGTHQNETAWGFLGVRLPLPEDKQEAADRVVILKALGVLDPETGEPTAILDAVKAVRMAKLDQASWEKERNKMLDTCSNCHSRSFAKNQLDMGDAILGKADRLMAEAITIVAELYKEGIIEKPASYPHNYPFLLTMMHTNGSNWDSDLRKLSYIDQILVRMYMKHRMRAYQAFFHVNPDYAYWYGWNMMTEDLGEIVELAKTMRATHKK